MTTSLTLDDLGYFAVPNEIPEADLLLRIQAHYVDGTSESTVLDNPGDDDVQYAVSQFYEKDHSDR